MSKARKNKIKEGIERAKKSMSLHFRIGLKDSTTCLSR